MRVLIVGAGLGGLCLAQGLRGLGVELTVLERDPEVRSRGKGYRLNLNANGAAGLAACLPQPLLQAHLATAHHQTTPTVTIRTATGTVLHSRRIDDEHALAVDRSTLRSVLLGGLGDAVHFGQRVTAVEPGGRVLFADGTDLIADLVVGADGARSTVRRLLAPTAVPRPVGRHVIYGRTPLDVPLEMGEIGTDALHSRFTGLVDKHETLLALGAWRPRGDVAATGKAVEIDPREIRPYMMWAVISRARVAGTPAQLHDEALRLLTGWTADARRVVRAATVADSFSLTLRSHTDVPVWEPGGVTLLGDAAHTMIPAGGEGANTALSDAAALTAAVAAHLHDRLPLAEAVASYERRLRHTGNAALARCATYGPQLFREDRAA